MDLTQGIPFAPTRASTSAGDIDRLFLFELGVSAFFVFLIFMLVVYFAIRFRRRSDDEVPPRLDTHAGLEAAWIIIPFALMLVMFFWGAGLYAKLKKPAADALEIHVVGKQWMWKIEHPGGAREIDELHMPVGRPVQLIMASQDVIHSFFIPAFRVKQDVVPGSYVSQWFQATRVGRYRLFCSQYCGTDHARMVGWVDVMEPSDYEAWLAGSLPDQSPAAAGQKLFTSYGCAVCHGQRAPTMAGLYMSRVQLQDGSVVLADENYLRDSILAPSKQMVAGYPPIMPSYKGQLSEEQLFQLIAYIKSLATVRYTPPATAPGTPFAAPSTQPAPGAQPSDIPNFPPAEAPPGGSAGGPSAPGSR